jgi:hypothetical protein
MVEEKDLTWYFRSRSVISFVRLYPDVYTHDFDILLKASVKLVSDTSAFIRRPILQWKTNSCSKRDEVRLCYPGLCPISYAL